MTNAFLLTIFINLLIAIVISFYAHYIAGQTTSGGFWVATLIALLGSYIGTFFGIVLQIFGLMLPTVVFQFVFPFVMALVSLGLFTFFDRHTHH